MRLRAIVTRGEITKEVLEKRASMLRKDSVHGYFKGSVKVDFEQKALIINGTTVFVISANQPEDPDYLSYGINDALIIDNTGAFRSEEDLSRHLEAKGVDKVLLTAPGIGNVPNIVYGVNQNNFNPDEYRIFSAARHSYNGRPEYELWSCPNRRHACLSPGRDTAEE